MYDKDSSTKYNDFAARQAHRKLVNEASDAQRQKELEELLSKKRPIQPASTDKLKTNSQLYREYLPTYNKICRMPAKQRRKFYNDPGFQWMRARTVTWMFVIFAVIVLLLDIYSHCN